MRSLDKPRDPSSTRMIQSRCRDLGYVANSCSRQKAQSLDLLRQLLFQADGSKPRSPAGLAAEPARICNRVLLRLQEGVQDEYNIQVRWGYGTLGHQDCKAVGGLGVGDTHMDSNNVHWHDQEVC